MRNHVKPGKIITFTNTTSATLKGGSIHIVGGFYAGLASVVINPAVGGIVGIVCGDVEPGKSGELARYGGFMLPKSNTEAIDAHVPIYFDKENNIVTPVNRAGYKLIGMSVESAIEAATEIYVQLFPLAVSNAVLSELTLTATVAVGDVIVITKSGKSVVVIALKAGDSGDVIPVIFKGAVWLPKAGVATDNFDRMFYDTDNSEFTNASPTNGAEVGACLSKQVIADSHTLIYLDGVFKDVIS